MLCKLLLQLKKVPLTKKNVIILAIVCFFSGHLSKEGIEVLLSLLAE